MEGKKKNIKKTSIVIGLLLLSFLISCNVVSVHPITSVKKAYVTQKILGTWVNISDKTDTFTIKIKTKPIYYYSEEDLSNLPFFISRVKGALYINFILNKDIKSRSELNIQKDANYAFMQLYYDRGKLGMSDIDKSILVNAIKNGELKGDLEDSDYDMIEIKSNSKEIYKFFKKYKKMKKNIEIDWYMKTKN